MCLEVEMALRSFLYVCRQQHPNFGSFLSCSQNPWQHISRIDKLKEININLIIQCWLHSRPPRLHRGWRWRTSRPGRGRWPPWCPCPRGRRWARRSRTWPIREEHCGHVTGCRVLIGRSGPEAGHLPAAAADGHGEVVEWDLLAPDHVVLVTCTRHAVTI